MAELESRLKVEKDREVSAAIAKTEQEALDRLTKVKIDHDNEVNIARNSMKQFYCSKTLKYSLTGLLSKESLGPSIRLHKDIKRLHSMLNY